MVSANKVRLINRTKPNLESDSKACYLDDVPLKKKLSCKLNSHNDAIQLKIGSNVTIQLKEGNKII